MTCTVNLSTTIKGISELMGMKKEEIAFFPKLNEIRDILKDYNFSVLTAEGAAEKIGEMEENLSGEELIYKEGLELLSKRLIYR